MDSDTEDYAAQKNESLNTPCGKKPQQVIKIIENRKLPAATFPLLPGTIVTGSKLLSAEKNEATKFVQKSTGTMTFTPTTSISSSSSVPIVINTKQKLMSSTVYKVPGKIESVGGGSGSGSIVPKAMIAGAATLTTIDGKTAVKTPSGKIIFIQKAAPGSLPKSSTTSTTFINSPTGVINATRLQQGTTSTNQMTTKIPPKLSPITAASGKIPLKTLISAGTSGLKVTSKKPMPMSAFTSTSNIVSKPTILNTSNVATRTTTTITTGGVTVSKQPVNGTNMNIVSSGTTKSSPLSTTSSITAAGTTSKVTKKPVQIKIVRTSDGKLIKLNPPTTGIGDLASATNAKAANSNTSASSGQLILKSYKKVGTEGLVKNFNIQRTASSIQSSTAAATTKTSAQGTTIISKPMVTTNNAGNTTTIRKIIPVTKVHPGGVVKSSPQPTPNIQANIGTTSTKVIQQTNSSRGSAMETKSIVKSSSLTVAPPQAAQVTRVTAGSGNTNTGTRLLNKMIPSSSLTSSNKVVVQNASGKPIVVANQQLVKLSSKPCAVPSTSAGAATSSSISKVISTQAGGKLQAVQMPGKGGGIRYVRLLPKGSSVPGKALLVSPTAQKPVDVAQKPVVDGGISKSNINSTATTTVSGGSTSGTPSGKTGVMATTILNSTLTPPSSSSTSTSGGVGASSGFKLLNSVPQKFTLVRSTKGHTKFMLKQSPSVDGPVSIISMQQKKPLKSSSTSSADGVASTSNEAATAATVVRKHKISDINMEIKRITAGSGTGDSDAAASDEVTEGPETKKARYVIMPRSSMQYKKILSSGGGQVGQIKSGTRLGGASSSYTLQRLTAAQGVCKQSPNILNSSLQSGEKSSSSNSKTTTTSTTSNTTTTTTTTTTTSTFPSSASNKQLYSIWNIHKNKGGNVRPYVVCNAATGEKSITIRRPFYSMSDMKIKSRKGLITSSDLERSRNRLNKNYPNVPLRTEGIPIKFANKTLFDKMKKPLTHQSLSPSSAISPQLVMSKPATASASSLSHTVEMATGSIPSAVVVSGAGSGIAGLEAATLASRRKHCNCSKSQCLKLYCDCFANGEFCQDCTCKDCCNNLKYEDERQQAIKNCLERNPSAFKPKITARKHSDMRLHNKGCNCKRSGCLKNYCECYEAKIPCSAICKCVGCRNMEDRPDVDLDYIESKKLGSGGFLSEKRLLKSADGGGGCGGGNGDVGVDGDEAGRKTPPIVQNNFITDDVIEATILCMISQMAECEKEDLPDGETEARVIEELGRCVTEIIDFSKRNNDSNQMGDSIAS